jgi:Na+-transporting NADH:ubiquinone oxidoreductase subunit NqrC
MGKNFMLALLLPQYQSERDTRRAVAIGTQEPASTWHGLIVVSLVAMTGIYYLVMANATATAGYAFKQIQGKITDLDKQYKELQVNVVETQSISSVQADPLVANMVQVSSVTYLQPNQGNLASNTR